MAVAPSAETMDDVRATLATAGQVAVEEEVSPPAIVVIGPVAGLDAPGPGGPGV